VPISGAKVDEAGNQNLVRKVCVNSKQFGEQKGSFNAYVRFGDAISATEALQANNSLFGSRHVRVDRVHPTLFDPRRSIFLGNLPHYADEEELREYFAKSLANGHDDIEGLRIIRDPNTLVGKGIGYLLLKDRDAVFKALQLDKSVFKKRWALRVSVCGKRTKRDHAREDQSRGDSERSTASDDERASSRVAISKAKVTDKSPVVSINASYAMKRIKMKSSSTRNQLLKERNQKNSKKGKRLGGVIKRAMKASRA
jgi:nucleolar protein 12